MEKKWSKVKQNKEWINNDRTDASFCHLPTLEEKPCQTCTNQDIENSENPITKIVNMEELHHEKYFGVCLSEIDWNRRIATSASCNHPSSRQWSTSLAENENKNKNRVEVI